jgi:predicted permease
MLGTLLNHIRHAVRGFALRPTFAAVVVVTLGIAIGANVAVFSLYDQVMLRELRVSNPGELVNFVAAGPKQGFVDCNNQGSCDEIFSYPMFRDLERAGGPFTGLAASRTIGTNLSFAGRVSEGTAVLVSGGYFSVLGVGPSLGRVLGPQDDLAPGEAAAAVLSYDYWSNELGADAAVLGKTIVVNGDPLEIVGVAPRGFVGTTVGERPRVFVPITFNWFRVPGIGLVHQNRSAYWAYVFGRLAPGTSREDAQVAINVPFRRILNEVDAPRATRLSAADLEKLRATRIELVPGARGQSDAPRSARTPLAVVLAATATILLLACVNLANLTFARGATRIGEMAVRTSMGAAPRQLFGMLTMEALLLSGAAAVVSLPVALAVLNAVGALGPQYMLFAPELSLSLRAVAAAFAIATLAAVIFALAPIVKLTATDPWPALQSAGARSFGGKGVGRFRFGLATAQIALSMLLLVLAGLFTQSLVNIARVDLGMRTESVVTFGVAPSLNGYTPERSAQLYDTIERDLRALPGVISVASSTVPVLSGSRWSSTVSVEGYEPPTTNPADLSTNMNYVGAGFLRTFEIPLLAGRDIADSDTVDSPHVAIVNQSFARKYDLGDNPIGTRLETGDDGEYDIEIVGLIRDSAYNHVKDDFKPLLMVPRRQSLQATAQGLTFYVRTAQAPSGLFAAIRTVVAQIDPTLPAKDVRTLESQVRQNVQTDRLLTTLAGALAAIATLLAAIGLYGVLSYTVAQRTREIGVRLALGAAPERVRGMVLKHVARMALIGVPLGVAGALGLGRLAAAVLYGLTPADPLAFAAAGVLLAVVVLGASYLPARRASRVDPVVALRSE